MGSRGTVVQERAAGPARISGTVTAAAVTSQISAGRRDAAHSGIEPSGAPPFRPQWVASRSGSRSRARSGIPASTAVTPAVQTTAVVRRVVASSLMASP
ncbi:hypothetical protein STENM223S_09975 [Streptomyces tendae]